MTRLSSLLVALSLFPLSASAADLFADYRTFHENDVLMVRLESGSRVKAVVKKVLPNGDLVLEGKGILGVARSLDIAQDNSVRSAYLSRAPLEVAGR